MAKSRLTLVLLASCLLLGGTAAAPVLAATSGGSRALAQATFAYQSKRGYKYRVRLSIGQPQVVIALGDPGKLTVSVPTTFVTGTVFNKTSGRPAPLAGAGSMGAAPPANLEIDAWVKFPQSLGKDYIQHQACNSVPYKGHPFGNCFVPRYLSVAAILQLGEGGSTVPIGGSVALPPTNQPVHGYLNDWFIAESHKAAWIKALTSRPSYITVTVDPGGFGNSPVSGIDGYDDYTCQNGATPVIAVFTGFGKLVPLAKGGCALAHGLM